MRGFWKTRAEAITTSVDTREMALSLLHANIARAILEAERKVFRKG
jgi:hypothetical protein